MSTARERILLRLALAKNAEQAAEAFSDEQLIASTRRDALQDALAEIDADALDEIAAMIAQDHATTIPASQKH